MEKRKESLSDIKLCRFCLTQDATLTSLYDRSRDPILVTLPLKIMACVSIEVFPSDKMPSYICERCRTFMDVCYDFKQICRRADESCLQFVQNGIPITAVSWPPSLTKIFQLTKRARPLPLNTVVEGGATIQVTSQEMSENEDDEETYNIKIDASGDGTKSGTTCIKVTPSGEKETAKSSKKAAVRKGVMVRVRRRSAGLSSWPCEQCDRSYPLHQLLEIHMAQKHRARNVQCSQCEAKFFSKYDLMTHQLRHTNEMPFQCVACNKKFKRLILLKRHEKMVHADLPKHLCTNCPAKFLSIEELESHKKRHEGYFSRQHVCTVCDRKFHTKGTLQRHRDVVHGQKHFSCEYCPHRFSTVSKLSRHVRTHAGERAYPCKYCNKSFMKSHHYTRHLRLKHEEQVRAARGADAEFRCEQCGESFGTQDDLYYHSAIHATQNLICPLCQEKFENVDAVTAHIRTHVNGIEFMCEYCELVFTSKEKLDAHMTAAHDDELTPRQELGLDESSLEADAGDADADADDDDEDGLNVKEEDGHMVVEIKKADGYMLGKDIEVGQTINTNSEDSEMEVTYTELATVDTLAMARAEPTKSEATSSKASRAASSKTSDRISILRKAEAIKRKAVRDDLEVPQKKERAAKVDSTTNIALSSDKSLRLLEKELQELKRTPLRVEGKSSKTGEAKSKRQPAHTSTPKLRSADERKSQAAKMPTAVEKKAPERRPVTKDNKEPKENKEARNTVTSTKEDKSVSSTKDDKSGVGDKEERSYVNKDDKRTSTAKEDEIAAEKQAKITSAQETKNNGKTDKSGASNRDSKARAVSKDMPSKNDAASTSTAKEAKRNAADKEASNAGAKEERESLKNGDTSSSEENVVRRSTRPSKIKNYASMIRDRTRMIRDEDDDEEISDDDSDLDKEADQSRAQSPVARRRSLPKRPKQAPPQTAASSGDRRRGRPRKEVSTKDVPEEEQYGDSQASKGNNSLENTKNKAEEPETGDKEAAADSQDTQDLTASPTRTETQPPLTNMVVSPTGQTLKKVPIRALPPGIKPLPLPINARRDLCQMQIGKKMVKVQKIVMTKAEVEAMAKKGLLELKDGTMVLKQGIKLSGSDPAALRSGLISPGAIRKVAATPTRCNFDGDDA